MAAETARINCQLEDAAYDIERGSHLRFKSDPIDPDEDRAEQLESNHACARSVPNESYRKSLMYYEMRLDRQLTRSFRLLHQLQNPALAKPQSTLSKRCESTYNEPISNTHPDPSNALPDIDNVSFPLFSGQVNKHSSTPSLHGIDSFVQSQWG